jgi:ubiquinone biosynthesis protein COQ4
MMERPRNRPLVALRAVLDLAKDPDDLPKVFKIIESLPGRTAERIVARMRATSSGRRLLAERPDIRIRLSNRTELADLPPGSLGRTYLEITDRAGITAQGIFDANMASREAPLPPGDLRFAADRMRDTHDLWHVVTGYGTDVLGEAALLAFSNTQAPNLGVGLILGFAYLQGEFVQGELTLSALLRDARRRAERASYLPVVEWEDLLARPLYEVRAQLGLGTAPVYTPLTTAELLASRNRNRNRSLVRRIWSRSRVGAAS